MKFNTFYSSSKSNLYTVESTSGKRLLIECGCTPKQLQRALDYRLDNIAGCLLSHEHRDHSRSAEFVMDSGIDLYMSKGTMESLSLIHRRIYLIEDSRPFKIGGEFEVFPFNVNHDAAEPLGFVVSAGNEFLLFVTDTSHIKQRFGLAFNIIAICCGYDKEILQYRVDNNDINETFAKRLLTTHMEKEVTKSYIRDCCNLSKCTEIHLLHMSGSNIKERVREEFEDEFFVKTFIAGKKKRRAMAS